MPHLLQLLLQCVCDHLLLLLDLRRIGGVHVMGVSRCWLQGRHPSSWGEEPHGYWGRSASAMRRVLPRGWSRPGCVAHLIGERLLLPLELLEALHQLVGAAGGPGGQAGVRAGGQVGRRHDGGDGAAVVSAVKGCDWGRDAKACAMASCEVPSGCVVGTAHAWPASGRPVTLPAHMNSSSCSTCFCCGMQAIREGLCG